MARRWTAVLLFLYAARATEAAYCPSKSTCDTSAPEGLPMKLMSLSAGKGMHRVCEVNFQDSYVARHLLCCFKDLSYDAFDLDSTARSKKEASYLQEKFDTSRFNYYEGDYFQTVKTAPKMGPCSLLIFSMARPSGRFKDKNKEVKALYNRRTHLDDLPNALRLLEGPRAVVVHGPMCNPPDPWGDRAECWQEFWHQLAAAGTIKDATCADETGNECTSHSKTCACLGDAQDKSVCTYRPPLLGESDRRSGEIASFNGETTVGPWRYFTLVKCPLHSEIAKGVSPPRGTCLFYKDGVYETGIYRSISRDGLKFKNPTRVIETDTVLGRDVKMTHNIHVLSNAKGNLYIGGQYMKPVFGKNETYNKDGVWLATIAHQRTPDAPQTGHIRKLFTGAHHNCVELLQPKRTLYPNKCSFDGRLTMVHFKGQLLLYARANMHRHGQRYVHVTISRDNGFTWSPFRCARAGPARVHTAPARRMRQR